MAEALFEHIPHGTDPDKPIVPQAKDEFGTLEVAIVHDCGQPELMNPLYTEEMKEMLPELLLLLEAGALDVQLQLQYPDVDIDIVRNQTLLNWKIIKEQVDYTRFLQGRNIHLLYPHKPGTTLSNSIIDYSRYCRDFVGTLLNRVVVGRSTEQRTQELKYYESILDRIDPSADIKRIQHGALTLGNVLMHDGKVYIGKNLSDQSSDFQEGIEELKEMFGKDDVVEIPLSRGKDLDQSLAFIPRKNSNEPRRVIFGANIHMSAIEVLQRLADEIALSRDQVNNGGLNIQWIDPETPVVALQAGHTFEQLTKWKFDTKAFDGAILLNPNQEDRSELSEIELAHIDMFKGAKGGSWRCGTGVLRRANDYNG